MVSVCKCFVALWFVCCCAAAASAASSRSLRVAELRERRRQLQNELHRIETLMDGVAIRGATIRWKSNPSKCVDVAYGRARAGTNVQIWRCDSDNPNQLFEWTPGVSKIRWAAHPWLCLDIANHAFINGGNVQLWNCQDGNTDQLFSIPSAYGMIRPYKHQDLCIDVTDHRDRDGSNLQIWRCGNSDQNFILSATPATPLPTPLPTSERTAGHPIRWKSDPSKCIDVAYGKARAGTNVQIWSCGTDSSPSPNQLFEWTPGKSKIRWAAYPWLCLDIADHRFRNGGNVQLWNCQDGNNDQVFSIPRGDGMIRPVKHQDLCMDVTDHRNQDGANLQLWTCGNSDQNFIFDSRPTPTPPPASAFDVIVVGGGLTGSVIAAQLAKELPNKKVLLLEAGRTSQAALNGTDPPAAWNREKRRWERWQGVHGLTRFDVPGNYPVLNTWSDQGGYAWSFDFVGRGVYQCKVLGGCGVMNGALSQIPSQEMFEHWPKGWRHADLQPYYEKVLKLFHVTQTPSSDRVHYLDYTGADLFKKGLARLGYRTEDALSPRPKAMGIPYVTADNGLRQSTASVFLPEVIGAPNFELRLESTVTKILHDAGTASGVEYTRHGRNEVAKLKPHGRIVLTAGTMNTARLLLNSGHFNDAVGKGVSDHAHESMTYYSKSASENAQSVEFGYYAPPYSALQQYNSLRSGGLAQYGPTAVAYIRDPSTQGGPEAFDVEAWTVSTGHNQVRIGLCLMRPQCSHVDLSLENGKLSLHGNPHLSCDRDRRTMAYAQDVVRKAMRDGKMRAGGAHAMNHWAGSCKLGACADPATLLVRGTLNVAVADASILPSQIWGHPALSLQALSLKAADVLKSHLRHSDGADAAVE
eukprot:TRINITY_DN20945_c0_g3_i1.p1 TRINITY_DN20945_c0_g3~~TRINITY_DN20945_c0_g3_i1.p1  ORF type:complete len:864 (+),score=107.60 TRINITY_DN20945_c0_g3_i1:151-2742(+)